MIWVRWQNGCQREAERYNVDNVMTKDLLKKVGLL